MVTLVTWNNIIFEINITSKMLHNKQLDLNSATKQLETTKFYLENYRSDEGFQQVLKYATDIAKIIRD